MQISKHDKCAYKHSVEKETHYKNSSSKENLKEYEEQIEILKAGIEDLKTIIENKSNELEDIIARREDANKKVVEVLEVKRCRN